MTIGFGLAILILIELYRSYRDPWREPSHGKILNMVRDSLVPIDRKNASQEARAEALHLRFIYRDRDLYGDTSIYRVRNIRQYADFLASQARITEAGKWNEYALRILDSQTDSESIAKINELALDARIAQGKLYKHDTYRQAAINNLRSAVGLAHAPESKVVALTLLVQALAYDQKFNEALQLGCVLLSIVQSTRGHDAPAVIETLVLLRDIEAESATRGAFTELHEILTTIDVQTSILGKDHFLLANDLERLAAFYRRRGDWDYARLVEKRAKMLVLLHRVQSTLQIGDNGLSQKYGARTAHRAALLRDVETVASWLEERGEAVDKHVAFHLRKRVGGTKK